MFKHCSRSAGFSLTELSIALAIISVILGSAVSVLITGDYQAKKVQTESKMDRITEAMAAFLALHKRIPCPSLPGVAPTHNKFGVEIITNSYVQTTNEVFCQDNEGNILPMNSDKVVVGAVPVKTLLLPDDYISDGWGNRFMYVVDADFVLNSTDYNANCGYEVMSGHCFALADETTDANITVNGQGGIEKTQNGIYLLQSAGPNGHGAYPGYGGIERINAYTEDSPYYLTDSDELENAELTSSGTDGYATVAFDGVFVQSPLVDKRDEIDAEDRLYFDDFLLFRTKRQLIADLDISSDEAFSDAPKLFGPECLYALEVYSNPASNRCSGADDEDSCQKFAVALEERCL